jgi:hypothetical protein
MTPQPAFLPMPAFPAPVSDPDRNEDERDDSRKPRLTGPSHHHTQQGIHKPESGDDEPDRGTAHFFSGA